MWPVTPRWCLCIGQGLHDLLDGQREARGMEFRAPQLALRELMLEDIQSGQQLILPAHRDIFYFWARPTQAHPSPPTPTQAHPGPPKPTQAHPSPPRPTQAHPGPPRPTQAHPGPPRELGLGEPGWVWMGQVSLGEFGWVWFSGPRQMGMPFVEPQQREVAVWDALCHKRKS